jgi:hypothetical protein
MGAVRTIIAAFYEVVESMTTVNNFNYTWTKEKSREKLFNKGTVGSRGKLSNRISIYAPSGENLDGTDINGGAQGEHNLRLNLEIHARVPMNNSDATADIVPYETMLDVMDGLEDIIDAYEENSKYANTICSTPAYNWKFVDYDTEIMEQEDKYNSVKLICRYIVDYRSQMGQRA